jgi:uncharacterized protein involved in exopolysaccharide biosynthesis
MVFARVFTAVFLLVCITSTVVTFILPESYVSTARVLVVGDRSSDCKIIRSDAVLGPAIDKLNLSAVWGRKYNAGKNLNITNTMQLLTSRLEVFPEPDARVIDIKVFSEDKNEAARIANAVAEAYRTASIGRRKASQAPVDPLVIDDPPVLIIDLAQPALRPCRPNKPLNLALGALAGIFLGLVAGGIVAGFVSHSKDAKPPERDPAKF